MKEDWERQPEMFLQEISHSLSKNPNEGLPAENQFDENGEKALSFQDDEIQSVQKIKQYSAEDQENSIVLDQKAILFLKQARKKQDIFLDSLGHLRDEIIQHQTISHISYGSSKFQRINYREVKEYTRSRIEKMTKNKKYKKNWSSSDIKILVWIVAKFCEKNKIKDSYGGIKEEDWETISSLIPGTTPESCMFKWLGLKKSKVREEKWQKEEQNLLIKLVQYQN